MAATRCDPSDKSGPRRRPPKPKVPPPPPPGRVIIGADEEEEYCVGPVPVPVVDIGSSGAKSSVGESRSVGVLPLVVMRRPRRRPPKPPPPPVEDGVVVDRAPPPPPPPREVGDLRSLLLECGDPLFRRNKLEKKPIVDG